MADEEGELPREQHVNQPGVGGLRAGDPEQIGPYRLLGRLGEGGMGTVYMALAPTGRPVAVKVVKAEFAIEEGFAARFHAEVDNARRVASFCTAQVLDNGNAGDGRPYMVTEYIAGTPLSRQIAEHGALEPGPLHGVALGVAAALAAIHVAGLVHRDLKPANVILSMSGPRVIDFGIARALDSTSGFTKSGEVLGSPGWWAPEQVRGQEITPAADVFAWGCLVAYAGNGRHPYGRGDMITMATRLLNSPPDLGALPAPLNDLARRATTMDPYQRPTAQDLLIALVGGGIAAPSAGPSARRRTDPPTLVATDLLTESWQPPPNVEPDSTQTLGAIDVLGTEAATPPPPYPWTPGSPGSGAVTSPGRASGTDTSPGRTSAASGTSPAETSAPGTSPGSGGSPASGAPASGASPVRGQALRPETGSAPPSREAGAATPRGGAGAPQSGPGNGSPAPGVRSPVPGPRPPDRGTLPPGREIHSPAPGRLLPGAAAPGRERRRWVIAGLAAVAALTVTGIVLANIGDGAGRATLPPGASAPAGTTDVGRRIALGSPIEDPQLIIPRPPACGLTSYQGATPKRGRFCVVRWTLVNTGGKLVPLGRTPLTLVDSQGAAHSPEPLAPGPPSALAPGGRVDGVFVYELPPPRTPARLTGRLIEGGEEIEVRLS
ncbi:serine/threonine-protein kinase [Planomonospora sp. ID67723]|uniref:serine/threonine-protein kinase n=1 Tax=Planomonospora sp. ID67723 TaxID=2738134 RepID=UPI001E556EA1|nr:serine/threonine-protein kinase [Planomonospora sp. ID67723]